MCDGVAARCAAGDAGACSYLGLMAGTLERYDRAPVPLDVRARGEGYLVRACALEVSACSSLTWYATEFEGGPCRESYANETRLLRVACALGFPPACDGLAHKLVDGLNLPRDTERAARLYASVCDAEDTFAPSHDYEEDGARVPGDDPMDAQLFACADFERLAELGMAGDARAKTTPERALELTLERARTQAKTRRSRTAETLQRAGGPALLATARRRASWIVPSAEEQAAAARRARQPGGLALCGPLSPPP